MLDRGGILGYLIGEPSERLAKKGLLLSAHFVGSGWLDSLACRIFDGRRGRSAALLDVANHNRLRKMNELIKKRA